MKITARVWQALTGAEKMSALRYAIEQNKRRWEGKA